MLRAVCGKRISLALAGILAGALGLAYADKPKRDVSGAGVSMEAVAAASMAAWVAVSMVAVAFIPLAVSMAESVVFVVEAPIPSVPCRAGAFRVAPPQPAAPSSVRMR